MGASTGGSGETGTVLAEINVTPFVDVMLVLLVIFMITTPMMHEMAQEGHSEEEMDLPLVRDDDTRIQLSDIDHIVLSIDENLQIYLGSEPLVDCGPYRDEEGPNPFEPCFDELQSKVENNHRMQEDGRVYLLGHTDIPYGVVVGAMNRIRLAGVARVGMVTNPEFRGEGGGESNGD